MSSTTAAAPTFMYVSPHPAPVPFDRTVLVRAPPKPVFQVLTDPTIIEEFSKWRVEEPDRLEEGATWTESRFLRKRVWTVTAFDRRGLSFTAEWNGVRLSLTAKKGGTGSCNIRMVVDGDERAVARFEKSDGDRLDLLRAYLED